MIFMLHLVKKISLILIQSKVTNILIKIIIPIWYTKPNIERVTANIL